MIDRPAEVCKNKGVGMVGATPNQAAADGAREDMTTPATDRTTTSVYRYYDSAGVLLYVGITNNGILRNRQHNDDKEWWPWVVTQQVDHFKSRDDAHAREVALIQQFRPPFNVQHNSDHAALRAVYVAARDAGMYDVGKNELLPPEFKQFDVDVWSVSHALGKAELRTRPEQAAAALRLRYEGRCQVSNQRGRKIGEVVSIQQIGPVARIRLELRRGWKFRSARVWLRPIMKKGPTKNYELKQVIATDAESIEWSEA